jgi:hypothetical protein
MIIMWCKGVHASGNGDKASKIADVAVTKGHAFPSHYARAEAGGRRGLADALRHDEDVVVGNEPAGLTDRTGMAAARTEYPHAESSVPNWLQHGSGALLRIRRVVAPVHIRC